MTDPTKFAFKAISPRFVGYVDCDNGDRYNIDGYFVNTPLGLGIEAYFMYPGHVSYHKHIGLFYIEHNTSVLSVKNISIQKYLEN